MVRQGREAHNAGWRVLTEGGAVADDSPTVRGQLLAAELRRLRVGVKKTQTEVARYVGLAPGDTTISKFENAERVPPAPHLRLMLQCYGVDLDSSRAASIVELAKQAKQRGWWSEHSTSVPNWFERYLGLETAADEVETYEAEYVPGLLQTSRYTEALTTPANMELPEGFAAVRKRRQQRLLADEPLRLRAVLNEAVLLRDVGGPEIMREQLASLLDAADRLNISLQVLPFSVGIHPGMHGPFTIVRFKEKSIDTVYVELRGGAVYLNQPTDIELHSATFEQLTALALTEEDTISLVRETERRL